jgi:hypothetical protein
LETWQPITAQEMETLLAKELAACDSAQRALFSRVRVPLRAVPILRHGQIESVFVVAQQGEVVVYYEDVEAGFNLSTLAADGFIASPGWEQWELRHALSRLDA